MKQSKKVPVKKLPVSFRTFKVWRDPRINVADIGELQALVNEFAVNQSPVPEAEPCEEIELTLLENETPINPGLVKALERWHERRLERHALQRAGEAFRRLLLSLPDTPTVIALRFALLGGDSLREACKRAGCSEQAASKALKMLRKSRPIASQVVTHLR
jgi:hypothetical protein